VSVGATILGDKLLPELLGQLAESVGPMLDNLDRAERYGWVASADEWLALRKLRNRMIHEYVRNAAELAQALSTAHQGVTVLAAATEAMTRYAALRFDLGDG
jgi:uncharacterized protein with HEPN domain